MNDAKWTSRLSQNETPCYPWGFKLTNLHIRPIVPENGLFIQVPVLSHHQNLPMNIWYLNVLKQVLSCFSFIECKTFEEITCCWANTIYIYILFFLSTEVSTSSNPQKDKIQTLKPGGSVEISTTGRPIFDINKKNQVHVWSTPFIPLQHFIKKSWESVGHGLQTLSHDGSVAQPCSLEADHCHEFSPLESPHNHLLVHLVGCRWPGGAVEKTTYPATFH